MVPCLRGYLIIKTKEEDMGSFGQQAMSI